MFTGIIQAVGEITAIESHAIDKRFTIQSELFSEKTIHMGESIAINGICLTVVAITEKGFSADVSQETLSCTNLQLALVGAKVNLETSLTLNSLISGHLVSGHVDGVGEVIAFKPEGNSWHLAIKVPADLAKYIAIKGSITVDGTSLTVNQVDYENFTVNIIPHTYQETIIQYYIIGTKVNLEVDIIARYLERLIQMK